MEMNENVFLFGVELFAFLSGSLLMYCGSRKHDLFLALSQCVIGGVGVLQIHTWYMIR